MPLLGAHISVAGGLHKAIERAAALGCEAIQIFTRNPLQWRGRNLSDTEAEGFRRALLESPLRSVVAHASYLINLAGADDVRKRSVAALTEEIERCYRLGIDAVVLHPGSAGGGDRDEAAATLTRSLETVLERTCETPVTILLETMSGQGGALGVATEELARVIDALGWDKRVGVCADICHLFGAGYDLRSEGGYRRVVSSLEKHIGLDRVGCWHMSDNKGAKGSRVDRHAHIGEGEIGVIPFGMLVSDARFGETPAILETPKDGVGDLGNLALLRKMRGAW